MNRYAIIFMFTFVALPLSATGEDSAITSSVQQPSQHIAPVSDEMTAIEIALDHFRREIDPKGPNELQLTGPQVYNDIKRKQWIVSWFFENKSRIAIVVNAETGKTYQADTGTD